jgi:hypothetical protein
MKANGGETSSLPNGPIACHYGYAHSKVESDKYDYQIMTFQYLKNAPIIAVETCRKELLARLFRYC